MRLGRFRFEVHYQIVLGDAVVCEKEASIYRKHRSLRKWVNLAVVFQDAPKTGEIHQILISHFTKRSLSKKGVRTTDTKCNLVEGRTKHKDLWSAFSKRNEDE